MRHHRSRTALVAVAFLASCAAHDDALSTTSSQIILNVAINGAPLTPETNQGQLDYGRVVMMDGARFVTTTTSTRKDPSDYTQYATIAVYDANFAPIAVTNFGNALDPLDGSSTFLMNGVVNPATGAYYFAGKSDAIGTDLCPLDNLAAPVTVVDQPYILKYHLDLATSTLVLDACVRIGFANNAGALKSGEISGMAIGDGRIFVGGSTTGTHVAIDNVPTLVAIRNAVGTNDPMMTVGALFNADAYIASFDLNLGNAHVLRYGTLDWEEVLDLQYDDVANMIYTAGSTHGDLCTAYAPDLSTMVCTTGVKNTSAAMNRTNVKFDAYVAAFEWVPNGVHKLKPRAFKQFGGDGEDTFNGLAFSRDLVGTTRLYLGGKYTPVLGGDMDARIVRMGVWGAGGNPDAIFLNASVETFTRGVVGSTDAAGEIAVNATHAYVVGVRNGTPQTHAGPCGDGPDSQLIPHIDRFEHALALAPTLDYEFVATTPLHRTGDVRGIAIDATGNRIVAYGTSNYADGTIGEDSFCGPGGDDNLDQLAATLFFDSL